MRTRSFIELTLFGLLLVGAALEVRNDAATMPFITPLMLMSMRLLHAGTAVS